MADGYNLGQADTLSPDMFAQQQALNRQQQMAQMLMQQGIQQPQGQMVSGRYVAPSFFQYLNPVAQMVTGAYLGKKGDEQATKLAQQIRELNASESADILGALRGTPAVEAIPEKITELAGPYGQGVGAEGQDISQPIAYEAGVAGKAAVPGSKEAAYARALRGYSPAAKGMAAVLEKQLIQQPDWKETSINQNGQIIKGLYDANQGDVMSTFRPFNSSVDVPLAAAQYRGEVPANAPTGAPMGGSNFVNQAQNAGLPIISGVRTPLQQAELRHHKDPVTGQWMTKEGRPVAENSAHLAGNAIDLNPKVPLNPQQQAWLNQNAYQPNPTKDSNHWELKPGASGQMPAATAFATTKYDLEVPKQFSNPKERDEWFSKSREPLTGEPLKMVTGAENTVKALRDFNQGIQGFNREDLGKPDKSAEMAGLAKNAILALKDAKGLGVLNKEDLPQLEAILRNPADWKNILNSKELFQKLADRQIEFAGNVIATNYKNSYKQMPESTKIALTKIDAEVAERKKLETQKVLDKPLMYQSPEAVDLAGKSGRIKEGQLIIIGNQKFRYKKD